MKSYFFKMRGGELSPPRPTSWHIIWSFMGGFVTIAVLAHMSLRMEYSLMMASFGATACLLFAFPDSPFSQPRNVVGGHFFSTLSGLVYMAFFGVTWWSMALALATAIVLMQITKTTHPPASSDALIVMLAGVPWSFLIMPSLIGSVILVSIALIFNNVIRDRRYPRYWM